MGFPSVYTLGFSDPAMAVTLTRTGNAVPGHSTHVFPLHASVCVWRDTPRGLAHRLFSGLGFVSKPAV